MKQQVNKGEGGEILAASPPVGVRRLKLSNFRNYRDLDIELSEGFNIIAGPNAQGKTNLLEALYLLSTARILRGVRDREAILQGEDSARVSGQLIGQPTEIEVRIEDGQKKAAYLNGMRLPRAADLLGRLPCVSVSSVDLTLAQGEPADRRLFLDLELSQSHAAYLKHFAQYKRSLEHRNALLKKAREGLVQSNDFDPWEFNLANSGSEIRRLRADFLIRLQPYAQDTHAHLAARERLLLRHCPKDAAESPEELLGAFVRNRSDDIQRGATSMGPHRDDFQIEVAELDARLFASQGQQRTAVISLKLATLLLAKSNGPPPLLLLDDMLSDLDQTRRTQLANWTLQNAGQAALTCTEPHAVGHELLQNSKVIQVQNGTATS